MAVTFKQFLLTGRLGPIYCGCGLTAQDILDKLGEPNPNDKMVLPPDGSIRRLRLDYQALGLHFENDHIAMYQLYVDTDGEPVSVPEFLEPEGDFPCVRKISFEDFLGYLIKENIPHREPNENEDSAVKVFTNAGVGAWVGGGSTVSSLIVPCPGTEQWKAVKERWRFRVGPPKPFPKS